MLLHTNNIDIKSEIKESALQLHEKLTHLPAIEYFYSNTHIDRTLKIQEVFLQKVATERNNLDISWKPSQILLPGNPLELNHINNALDLITANNKQDVCSEVL